MQAHLTEAGGELTQAITIKFNDNWSQVFYPRMETVDFPKVHMNSTFFQQMHGILQLILIALMKQIHVMEK